MRVSRLFLMIVICNTACGLRQKHIDKVTTRLNTKLEKESTGFVVVKQSSITTDSSELMSFLQIKPIGKFTYSAKDGFIGEAEGLKVAFAKKKVYQRKASNNLVDHKTEKLNEQNNQLVTAVNKNIKTLSLSWVWFFLFVFMSLSIWLLWRRIINFFSIDNKDFK